MKKQLLITSGKGPKECNIAVSHAYQIMEKEAKGMNLLIEIISAEKDNGMICSIIISIEGMRAKEFVEGWMGTIQWICQSPIRPHHKRKNWYIAVLSVEYKHTNSFDERKIHFQAMRSSGAGGQHVNNVSSAIRATYAPLNISVQVMDTRSQVQNKQIAIQRIKEKIKLQDLKQNDQILYDNWINQNQIIRGKPTRVFAGIKFVEK